MFNNTSNSKEVRVSEDVLRQAALSDRLREMFADVLSEPVPNDFANLVARLRQDDQK